MEQVNDRFSIDDIKNNLYKFANEIHSYISGALRIFTVSSSEELSQSEKHFVYYLKELDKKVTELVKEHITFFDIMEVHDYNLKELYQMLDNFKLSYETILDSSVEAFLEHTDGYPEEEQDVVEEMADVNNRTLKVKFMTNAAELIFDNVSEFHERLKRLMDN